MITFKWKKLESKKTYEKSMPKVTLDSARNLIIGIAPTQRIAPPNQSLPRTWMSSAQIKILGESICKSSELSRRIPMKISIFLTRKRVKIPWHFPKSKSPKSRTIWWQRKISNPATNLPRTVQTFKSCHCHKNVNSKQMRVSTTLLT